MTRRLSYSKRGLGCCGAAAEAGRRSKARRNFVLGESASKNRRVVPCGSLPHNVKWMLVVGCERVNEAGRWSPKGADEVC